MGSSRRIGSRRDTRKRERVEVQVSGSGSIRLSLPRRLVPSKGTSTGRMSLQEKLLAGPLGGTFWPNPSFNGETARRGL